MSAPNYLTSAALKATLELTSETFADADIAIALSASSRAIDDLCHRRFYPDANASQVRYYTPTSALLTSTDDLITLTELAVDTAGDGTFQTVWTANTDFFLAPFNAPADGWPFTYVKATRQRFPACERSVRVTGMFGWAATPDKIIDATGLLASRLLRRAREAPFGILGFALDAGSTAAVHLARNDPDVMMLAGTYVRLLVR